MLFGNETVDSVTFNSVHTCKLIRNVNIMLNKLNIYVQVAILTLGR